MTCLFIPQTMKISEILITKLTMARTRGWFRNLPAAASRPVAWHWTLYSFVSQATTTSSSVKLTSSRRRDRAARRARRARRAPFSPSGLSTPSAQPCPDRRDPPGGRAPLAGRVFLAGPSPPSRPARRPALAGPPGPAARVPPGIPGLLSARSGLAARSEGAPTRAAAAQDPLVVGGRRVVGGEGESRGREEGQGSR